MIWLVSAAVAVAAFLAGFMFRGGRRRSPVEEYERRQQRTERDAELAAAAGTMDEVRLLVASGNKIAAIKAFREQTHAGLREAKGAVEALEQEMKAGAS